MIVPFLTISSFYFVGIIAVKGSGDAQKKPSTIFGFGQKKVDSDSDSDDYWFLSCSGDNGTHWLSSQQPTLYIWCHGVSYYWLLLIIDRSCHLNCECSWQNGGRDLDGQCYIRVVLLCWKQLIFANVNIQPFELKLQ